MSKSNVITWSSTYSVGVPLIDKQHQGLIKLTNDLYNHCVEDAESERMYFKQVIKSAVEYINVHFSTEEKLMLKTSFPGYAEHKKQHETFVLNVLERVKVFEETKVISLLNFTHFLKDWTLAHIAISDKQYFEYFKKISSMKNDGTFDFSSSNIPI